MHQLRPRTFVRALGLALSLSMFLPASLTASAHAQSSSERCDDDAKLIINVNTASAEQLERLPRIGPARARALVRTRERLGGFKRPSQLLRVKGIGRATLRGLLPHIRLTDPASATPNGTPGPDPVP